MLITTFNPIAGNKAGTESAWVLAILKACQPKTAVKTANKQYFGSIFEITPTIIETYAAPKKIP
jgi:hypothetical protein